MTDSGEVWTFLLNTTSSCARECFMYGLRPGHAMANGGDDTIRLPAGSLTAAYLSMQHIDPCTDKRFESEKGEFVSFIYFNGCMVKDPIILLKRFLGKISMGSAEDAVLGYADLWSMNYRHGDLLFDVLDEDEMDAHQIMTHIMFNLKKKGIKRRPVWDSLGISLLHDIDVALDISHQLGSDLMSQVVDVSTPGNIQSVVAGLMDYTPVISSMVAMME
jgi:hypothetical protein